MPTMSETISHGLRSQQARRQSITPATGQGYGHCGDTYLRAGIAEL